MTSIERWLPIAGYEGLYEISDRGRVKSFRQYSLAGEEVVEAYG
ncbi:MAG TPA: NUMOD4 domain-containing protein [Ktedonobacteraceae bacterium]|nr:NUMOD4 domain-containing protein [Ktedonobacteraceae bacterium]